MAKNTGPIELGDRVKDPITGMTGIATGIVKYLWGCRHICIQPEDIKDGKPVESTFMDEDRLEVVKRGVVPIPESAAVRAGGPQPRPMVHR